MFKVLKLKPLLITITLIIISITLSIGIVSTSSTNVPKNIYTIVIDAGHGGRDDGCTGTNGTKESFINLSIARRLKEYLETLGINVVMTRHDSNGLYDATATNFKLSDMENRIKIIDQNNPNMVISIHQNSYADKTQKGAQVFYQENDDKSKEFAEAIQSQLINQLEYARNQANFGDYYLLKESKTSAVIIECGYLSNADEETKLNEAEYQNKIAYSIMCGVVKYLGMCGND